MFKDNNLHIVLIILFLAVLSVFTLVVGINFGLEINNEQYTDVVLPTILIMGTWIAAIGTCSAVMLSLWLALKQLKQDDEILEFDLAVIAFIPDPIGVLSLNIVSKGDKSANIVAFTWIIEETSNRLPISMLDPRGTLLPKMLGYGMYGKFLFPNNLIKCFPGFITEHKPEGINPKKIKLVVSTSTRDFDIYPNDDVIEYFKMYNIR